MSSISSCSSCSSQSQAVRQTDPREQQRKADFEKALLASGADSTQVDSIQSQIKQAIADAVKNGGATNGQKADPSTIKNAVDGVLKANGLDVQKFSASMEASRSAGGAHRGHKHGAHKSGQGVPQPAPAPVQDDPSKGNQIDLAA